MTNEEVNLYKIQFMIDPLFESLWRLFPLVIIKEKKAPLRFSFDKKNYIRNMIIHFLIFRI